MMTERQALQFPVAHATLHGELLLPANTHGIAVFVAACNSTQQAEQGDFAQHLHINGFGTLTLDLLVGNECNFTDAEFLPHLAERLLAVLTQIRRMMDAEAIPEVPLALIAAGDATPLAVRVAALRDLDVGALICHGGLVDLAGLQYLKVLRAPLLMLVAKTDQAAIANLQRAKEFMPGVIALEQIDTEEGIERVESRLASEWLQRYLHG